MEWLATCNLKVKHRPSGSPITVYSLMGTRQTCILGAQRAPLFFPVQNSAMMWEMTVDMERGQISVFALVSQGPSDLPFNPYETCTETCHMQTRHSGASPRSRSALF